mgnify:CR=1 FL=1|jgi:hypothetical protein
MTGLRTGMTGLRTHASVVCVRLFLPTVVLSGGTQREVREVTLNRYAK